MSAALRPFSSDDDGERISRIFHACNVLERFEDGCTLAFETSIQPTEDDMIVLRLANGEERTLHVEQVDAGKWIVSHMKAYFNTHLTLVRLDRRSFRVIFDAHHRNMPEAF
jgi:hypothetical protein